MHINLVEFVTVRDGLENLWGEGAGEVQKKYSRKGKLNEKKKNSCTPINLKPKKDLYKEFDNEKNSAAKKFPSPPL